MCGGCAEAVCVWWVWTEAVCVWWVGAEAMCVSVVGMQRRCMDVVDVHRGCVCACVRRGHGCGGYVQSLVWGMCVCV